MLENQITNNFIYLVSLNFVTISHINYWDQVNSWKNLWKFWNGPLFRNKSGPFPLLNVAAYWKSSNTEACPKNLSQILANNIDNGERRSGLRIYMRYYILFRICSIQWRCSLFLFRPETLFLGKVDPKNQNCHFKLKFATSNNP